MALKQGLRLSRNLAEEALSVTAAAGSPVAWVATAEECSRGWKKKLCSPSTPPPPPTAASSTSSTSSSLELPWFSSASARSKDPACIPFVSKSAGSRAPACIPFVSESTGSRAPACTSSRSTCARSTGLAFFSRSVPGMGAANSFLLRTSPSLGSRTFSSSTNELGLETGYSNSILKPPARRLISSWSTHGTMPNLPPLTQLSFDAEYTELQDWVGFVAFLSDWRREPFPIAPPGGLYSKRLSADEFRRIERDILKLVELNRKRGYDIADELKPENISISWSTGRVKLNYVSGALISPESPFMGYQAAGLLFRGLFNVLYGGVSDLSEDTEHLLCKLDSELCDHLLVYDASLLGRAGRIGLTMKISILLNNDFWMKPPHDVTGVGFASDCRLFYKCMPYTSNFLDHYPTDEMHDNFSRLRSLSDEFKDQDRTKERLWQRQRNRDMSMIWKGHTGKWVGHMIRNGTVHPPYGLSQTQAVDQLHSHTALYLPKAQEIFYDFNWWYHLEMNNFFPER